jgi:hypothetical protein
LQCNLPTKLIGKALFNFHYCQAVYSSTGFISALPELKMNITVNTQINSPKDRVWAAITDFENCTNMISAIVDLKVIHKPEQGLIGLKWIETRRIFGKEATETMWITDCNDGEYYCTRAENCGAIYSTKIVLAQVGDKTRLTMSFSSTSDSIFVRALSSFMSLFFKKSMVRMLEKDIDDIKVFVEKQ